MSCQVVEKNTDNLILTLTQELESYQVTNQLNDLVSPFYDSLNIPLMDIVDTCKVDFNLKNGFPNQVEYWRTFSMDSTGKQTAVSILQVPY